MGEDIDKLGKITSTERNICQYLSNIDNSFIQWLVQHPQLSENKNVR